MPEPIYLPILKGKEGEYSALEALTPDVKELICPLIEVPEIPFDYIDNRPAKSLEEHVRGVAEKMEKCWGTSGSLYIDIPWLDTDELTEGDVHHPLSQILQDGLDRGLQVIPVFGFDRPESYKSAVKDAVDHYRRGFCLRLRVADFAEDRELETEIDVLLQHLGTTETEVDVLIDLGDLRSNGMEGDEVRDLMFARATLGSVPLRQWRMLALAAASFPVNLSGVDSNATTLVPRSEWRLWNSVRRHPTRLPANRVPIFGDYAISNPFPTEMDPRMMRMSASIRYTTEDSWLVVKGKNVRNHGYEQYRTLSRALIDSPAFYGPGYSWGDQFITECAGGKVGTGNATSWRKVGTNHHLTVVARQISTSNHTGP